MKKTVLNWTGQALAIVALSLAAVTTTVAQSVDQEFARELKLVEGLKVYNDQLAKQLDAQQKAKSDIRSSILESRNLGPQVVPLMNNMLEALEQFIRADLPFHLDERLTSVAELRALMLNSEASDSDRFRNIMDIYTVETEYGNDYEAYPSVVDINGTETPVDMLRIGRLGLYYQTKDQASSGMWDQTTKSWVALPGDSNRAVRKAIKVAAKTVAPELLSLQISAPKG